MERKKVGKAQQESEILKAALDMLKKLKITNEQFRGGRGGISPAHNAVVDAIGGWWEETRSVYLERYGKYIDFVGREKEHGKIELAVEVDRGHKAQGSWDKLADINAENKMWIYLTDSQRAPARFDEALRMIKRYLLFRGAELARFGNFVVAMKTPTDFKAEYMFR